MSRVALVTGGARGIGAATVARLVADGYRVMTVDSCEGAPLATRAELDAVAAAHGNAVLHRVVDVRDRGALAEAVAHTLETWGRLDVAVASAAVIRGGAPLWETSEADLDLLWDVDAKGVWNTAAVAVPAMLAGPDPSGCRFVAVASAAGSQAESSKPEASQPFSQDCPGRKPPFSAVKRPARPYESPIQNGF